MVRLFSKTLTPLLLLSFLTGATACKTVFLDTTSSRVQFFGNSEFSESELEDVIEDLLEKKLTRYITAVMKKRLGRFYRRAGFKYTSIYTHRRSTSQVVFYIVEARSRRDLKVPRGLELLGNNNTSSSRLLEEAGRLTLSPYTRGSIYRLKQSIVDTLKKEGYLKASVSVLRQTRLHLVLWIEEGDYVPHYRKEGLEILGTSIYEGDDLKRKLRLNYRKFSGYVARTVKNKLTSYYRRRGYSYVRVYVLNYGPKYLTVYVDEGRFGRVIIHDAGAIDILSIRNELDIPGNVYHPRQVRYEISTIKKKLGFYRLDYKLKPSRQYDDTFQIDRGLDDLLAEAELEIQVARPAPRYNLHLYVIKSRHERTNGFFYGARIDSFYGLIPFMRYWQSSWLDKGDRLETEVGLGAYYGLDLKFSTPPRFSYAAFESWYRYKPLFGEIFQPETRFRFSRTRETRLDIGLQSYYDSRIKALVGPGFNITRELLFSFLYGFEGIFSGNAELDPAGVNPVALGEFLSSDGTFLEAADTYWQLLEVELGYTFRPKIYDRRFNLKLTTTYSRYIGSVSLNMFKVNGDAEVNITDYSSYIVGLESRSTFTDEVENNPGDVPFYFEERINGHPTFRGFIGRDYFSRNLWRLGNEYRQSIYKETLYAGLWVDSVLFEGSDYDVSGYHVGLAGGASFYVILLDQLNVSVYLGPDLLVREAVSQFNMYTSASLVFQ